MAESHCRAAACAAFSEPVVSEFHGGSSVRIAVMGSGGVGGFFGGLLAKGGAPTCISSRAGRISPPCASTASRVEGPAAFHLPKVSVTDDPKTIGPVDLVMFCVKLWDTEAAARQLLPIVGPDTGHHLVPERRAEGRHAAPDLRRQGADGRRLLCRHDHRPAGRDHPDRSAAAHGVRRIRWPPLGARGERSSRPASGRHQRRAQRRRAALDLGEVRGAGRDVGRHHVHAQDHRAGAQRIR